MEEQPWSPQVQTHLLPTCQDIFSSSSDMFGPTGGTQQESSTAKAPWRVWAWTYQDTNQLHNMNGWMEHQHTTRQFNYTLTFTFFSFSSTRETSKTLRNCHFRIFSSFSIQLSRHFASFSATAPCWARCRRGRPARRPRSCRRRGSGGCRMGDDRIICGLCLFRMAGFWSHFFFNLPGTRYVCL